MPDPPAVVGPDDGAAARPSVAVAVLAGGGSRRMGRDKAAIEVEGRTLLERALAAAGQVASPGAPVHVIGTSGSPASAARGRWVQDRRPGQGPLAGLETALTVADDAAAVLVVAVDHPWLAPAVLARLVETLLASPEGVDGVVLGTADGPQPLLGAYRPEARARIGALLDAGVRRLQSVRDALHLEVLPEARWRPLDPLGATAVDVDDPEGLAAAVRWHERATARIPDTDRAEDDAPPTNV